MAETKKYGPEMYDEPLQRSPEQLEEAYGGKEGLDAMFQRLTARIESGKKPAAEEPEGEAEPTEDKFLPRRKR